MNMAHLKKAQAEVAKVAVTDETVDALIQIRDACKVEGIVASDRRWKKSLKIGKGFVGSAQRRLFGAGGARVGIAGGFWPAARRGGCPARLR